MGRERKRRMEWDDGGQEQDGERTRGEKRGRGVKLHKGPTRKAHKSANALTARAASRA